MDAGGAGGFQQRHSNKRSYSDMQAQHRTASESPVLDDHYHNRDHPAQRTRYPSNLALPPLRSHFAGDGFDYRRPAHTVTGGTPTIAGRTGRNADVIDLTAEEDGEASDAATSREQASAWPVSHHARLPRFGRDIIISIQSDEEDNLAGEATNAEAGLRQTEDEAPPLSRHLAFEPEPHGYNTHGGPIHSHAQSFRSSPTYGHVPPNRPQRFSPVHQANPQLATMDEDEVEIVASRPVSRLHTGLESPPPQITPPAHSMRRDATPYPNQIDLTEEDDEDDVVEVGRRQTFSRQLPDLPGTVRTRLNGAMDSVNYHQNRVRELVARRTHFAAAFLPFQLGAPGEGIIAQIRPQASLPQLPVQLDYTAPAFDILDPGARRSKTPPYQPPDAAEEGFTRNPGEDEVVVCPRCGHELAISDDEIKQQVWAIKGCGHVYCGTCARNREKKGNRKGKLRAADDATAPLRTCVVKGCEKPAHGTKMIQVYLS